jgi:TolA-binding protein
LSIGLGWGESAINILNKFIDIYPNHKRTPEALFYKAFVYDNQLNDDVKAGEVYREYLEKYPNHEYASSADASIKNLGKSDEDLVREFEAKMQADSTVSASAQ